jgi:hypothetical protein
VNQADDDLKALELARGELAERLKRQNDEVRALDMKAQILVGFTVTALVTVVRAPMPDGFRIVSALLFLPALCFGGMALAIWKYRDPVVPDELVKTHLAKGHKGLLLVVIASHRSVVKANTAVIRERIKHWNWGLGWLAAAIAAGVIGLAIGDDTVSDNKDGEQGDQQNQSLADQVEAADVMSETVQKDAQGGSEKRSK